MGRGARLLVAFVVLIGLVSTALAQNPLAKKGPPPGFVGAFAGKDMALELAAPTGTNGEQTGTLTFQGKPYPCRGTERAGVFSGEFTVGPEKFPFTVEKAGDAITLTSADQKYPLAPSGPANPLTGGNPLVRGGPPPAPPAADPRDRPAPANGPPPAPPASDGMGGVGIAFAPNADGELVVAQVLPGGPAAKAGVKPGGILQAVDRKPIDDMKPEELRKLIGGKVGTMVTLTIETPDEVMDVILQRADLSKFAPPAPPLGGQPQPPPGEPRPGPAPMPPDGRGQGRQPDPMPAAQAALPVSAGGFGQAPAMPGLAAPQRNLVAPAWMKPGVRLSFWAGSASVASAGQILVPDDNGDWVSKGTGQKFAVRDNFGAGGWGYQQATVANIVGDSAVVDFKQYLFNPESRACTTTIAGGSVVSLAAGSETWVPPQRLAQMQDINANGVRIMRGPYPLNGKTYNAIYITTATDSGATRYTYDLDTGIMLTMGSSTTGGGGWTPGVGGKSHWGEGNTMIAQIFYLGMRQTNLPWTGQRGSGQVLQLRGMEFAGQYTSAVQQAGQVSWPISLRWEIGKIDEFSHQMKTTTHINYGNTGLPNDPTVNDRGGSLAALWIDPRALAGLRQGQVLDEDPVTNMRTAVAGVQNGAVMIAEQGRIETSIAAYNAQTGLVQAMSLQTTNGIGTTTINLQRQR